MAVFVSCDRTGCEAQVDIGREGYWSKTHPASVGVETVSVELPEGWVVDRINNGLDEVIHCPDHAGT